LNQKKWVNRTDQSELAITAEGADFLESNYSANLQRRRLNAAPPATERRAAS
jgi:hypothetical protein